jgi:hemoglobin
MSGWRRPTSIVDPNRSPSETLESGHSTWFAAESFGGPDRFTRQLGFDYLIGVHRHLEITEEERQRFTALPADGIRPTTRKRRTGVGTVG